MTQQAINYGRALFETGVSKDETEYLRQMLQNTPELLKTLECPTISEAQKSEILNKVFEKTSLSVRIQNFVKLATRDGYAALIPDALNAYTAFALEAKEILPATLFYVTEPTAGQEQGIRQRLCEQYQVKDVMLTKVKKTELIGGFVLKVQDKEMDYSLAGKTSRLEQRINQK